MKKVCFLSIFAIGVFVSCLSMGNNTSKKTSGKDWPPETTLAEWGLSGMTQPDGLGKVEWMETKHFKDGYPVMRMQFGGRPPTCDFIEKWLKTNGWTGIDSGSVEEGIAYTKGNVRVNYIRPLPQIGDFIFIVIEAGYPPRSA